MESESANRESKQNSKYSTKLILEALAADKDLMDISDDDASDYEEELKKEKLNKCEFSSEDEEDEKPVSR